MIIWLILAVLLIYYACRILSAVKKRKSLISTIKKICNENRFTYRQTRKPCASFFSFSETPDIIIEMPEKLYCIRTFPCIKRKWSLNFVYENTVLYEREYFMLHPRYNRFGQTMLKDTNIYTRTSVKKSRVFPQMRIPDTEKNVEKILLFNPVPKTISSCNIEHTRMRIIGNTDRMFDYTVTDGPWFCDHFASGKL